MNKILVCGSSRERALVISHLAALELELVEQGDAGSSRPLVFSVKDVAMREELWLGKSDEVRHGPKRNGKKGKPKRW